MGFFSGYSSGGAKADSVLAGLVGLGKLTSGSTRGPSSEATRVVRAFVRGERSHGSCSGAGADRKCAIATNGRVLVVNGHRVMAERSQHGARIVRVCFPSQSEFEALENGGARETQESKDVRAVAGALFHALHTGLGVKTDSNGFRRFVGAHGQNKLLHGGGCASIRIPPQDEAFAAYGTAASERARVKYGKPFPTTKEISHERKALHDEVRAAAKAKAKLAKAAAAAAKAEAAAMAKRVKEMDKSLAAGKKAKKARKPRGKGKGPGGAIVKF
jgi:ribosomal protein L14E/L6E/L27E